MGEEVVGNLAKYLVRCQLGVVLARDDDGANAFGSGIGMECIVWQSELLVLCPAVAHTEHLRVCESGEYLPCSWTACRTPALVRSATILANMVMNSP